MDAGPFGRRASEVILALSQLRQARLSQIAAAIGAPLTSAQRATATLRANGIVLASGSRNPDYGLDPEHPAAEAAVELAHRIIPPERAMDIVVRSSPAVESAGRDRHGYVIILSPFADQAAAARLEASLVRINRSRPDAIAFDLVERDDLRDRMREDAALLERGRRLVEVRGSLRRAFREPDERGSLGAAPLHRLHPSLPKVPARLLPDLARRHGLARVIAFGSSVREDFRPDSDVDVVFEPRPGVRLGLAPRMEIQERLERALGRDVDLVNARALSDDVRRRVEAEGVVLHG
jgi:uncharacterized protein